MIVNDLHIESVTVLPAEAQPPLIVDANTVLTDTIATQRLEPVSRRIAQFVKSLR